VEGEAKIQVMGTAALIHPSLSNNIIYSKNLIAIFQLFSNGVDMQEIISKEEFESGLLFEKQPPIEEKIKELLLRNNSKAFSLTKIAEEIGFYTGSGALSTAISLGALMSILIRMEEQGIIKSKPVSGNVYYMLAC
jgi:hypothetical protein